MRAVVQRVNSAGVLLPGGERRKISRGILVFLGVGRKDTEADARRLAEKIVNLRIFPNSGGKFDRSVLEEKGEALVISQFTLYGSVKGGRRPDFTAAAPPEPARALYARFAAILGESIPVRTGEFGAHMQVDSVNDGPVTIWADSEAF